MFTNPTAKKDQYSGAGEQQRVEEAKVARMAARV